MKAQNWLIALVLFEVALGQAVQGQNSPRRVAPVESFPAFTQFSPVPSGKGWKGEKGPLTDQVLRETVDEIRAHGFTGLASPVPRPP